MNTDEPGGAHAAREPQRIPVATVTAALVAVVLLQVLFAVSHLAAFHDPQPHGIDVAVAGPTRQAAQRAAASLRSQAGRAVTPRVVGDEAAARHQVRDRSADAGLVAGADGDRLLTASAASVSVATLLQTQLQAAEQQQGRTLAVTDLVPLPAADSRGVGPFYAVLVLIFGAYLGVTVLSLVTSFAASHARRAALRIGAMAAYSVVSALAVVLTARVCFGLFEGHVPAAAAVGALVCFTASTVAITLQALLGTLGTGLVIVLFVIVGNPTSGGALAYDLLPAPMRAIGPYLVNGAGVDLLRNVVYFDSHAIARPVLVLVVWALLGSLGAVLLSARRYRRLTAAQLELAPALAAGL